MSTSTGPQAIEPWLHLNGVEDSRVVVKGDPVDQVYAWIKWSTETWPGVRDQLGPTKDRFRHVSRPHRPINERASAELFTAEQQVRFGHPLNSVGFPMFLEHPWQPRGTLRVQNAMLLAEGEVFVYLVAPVPGRPPGK